MEDIMSNRLNLTRDELIDYLKEGSKVIYFRKVNGDIRRMECTLNPVILSYVNKTEVSDANHYHADDESFNHNTIVVWELENGWRSFRVDSVLDVIDADYDEETR